MSETATEAINEIASTLAQDCGINKDTIIVLLSRVHASGYSDAMHDLQTPVQHIDTMLLAQAIRLVERTRAHVANERFAGPESTWYDGYAEDISTQYDLLVRQQS